MQGESEVPTIGEIISRKKLGGFKAVVIFFAGLLFVGGLIYTGLHNLNLFTRAVPESQKVFAFVPVILLEGSIILALLGSFVWFHIGTQKTIGTIFGWVLFLVVAANTVIDSMFNAGEAIPDWMSVYSTLVMWATPVFVIAVWKAIIDADPAKHHIDMQRQIDHAVEEAKFEAALTALKSTDTRDAVKHFGDQYAGWLNERIRGSSPQSSNRVEAKPKPALPQPAKLNAESPRIPHRRLHRVRRGHISRNGNGGGGPKGS